MKRECPKKVILKMIFISVCHQENEVFHKSFASLWGKRVRFGVTLQDFNRRILFYLQILSVPVNFIERKFDRELYLLLTQWCHYLESNILMVLNVCLAILNKNKIIQHIFQKNSFLYCRTVWFVDSDKIAFEKILNNK